MKSIPATQETLALRTDYSDEAGWGRVCRAIKQPEGEFRAYVEFVSDPEFSGLTLEQLVAAPSEQDFRSFAFLIDHTTLVSPEQPILVVDFSEQPGRTFRVIPAEASSVENNLSLGNMDFSDFANAVDPDGVFRGFPRTPPRPLPPKPSIWKRLFKYLFQR